MCLLAFLIYVIEFRNKRRWTPFFNVFGKNALFIYLLSELLITVLNMIPAGGPGENVVDWANRVFYHAIFPGAIGSLLFSLTYMMICWCVGKWLDYKKIYIRV